MPTDKQVNMIDELLSYVPVDNEPALTEWELEFLASISRSTSLSADQAKKLDDIWDEIFG
jgi:hypothetical protein